MARTIAILLVLFLSGCSALPDWAWISGGPARNSQEDTGNYNFSWRLSGDREVAPVQVFDNGRQTWLQFAPGQAIPAIFERSPHGDRLLDYRRDGPYLVLPGVWASLVLRGGHLKSFIDRTAAEPAESQAPLQPLPQTELQPVEPVSLAQPRTVSDTLPHTDAPPATIGGPAQARVPDANANVVPPPAPEVLLPPAASALNLADHYHVSPQDSNLRAALSRWARSAGWTFEPEHWVVDADIPIVASASFESGFKSAVQELVATTELADRPLQPCFYSNKVLRIVPYAQLCDRTTNLSESS